MSLGGNANTFLLRALYRNLLRHGRSFDKHPILKAAIPFPLPFSIQVLLGGKNRDFYGQNASVREAVREGFHEALHSTTDSSDSMRIDLVMKLQSKMSTMIHLLSQGGTAPLPPSMEVDTKGFVTYEDRYGKERATDSALDEALNLLEEAQRKCEQGRELEEIHGLYDKSIALKPTSDAHTYKGYLLSQEGDYNGGIAHCRQAMLLDPNFGNAYNDMGLFLWKLGRLDEAMEAFEDAKTKPRYDHVRYKPYLNLGHMKLELDRPHQAVTEYLLALHYAGPSRGREIRGVIVDMVAVLTELPPNQGA